MIGKTIFGPLASLEVGARKVVLGPLASLGVGARKVVLGPLASLGVGTRLSALALALATLSACSDGTPKVDADLARDLQLATAQQQAEPHLNDAPLAPKAENTPDRSAVGAKNPRPRARNPEPKAENPPDRSAVGAENPRPRARNPEPKAENPPDRSAVGAENHAPRGILTGTSFGLSTRGQVCTNNRPGDKIVATISDAVVGEDGSTIPAGSSVVLEVASVTPGDTPESAQISLRVRSVIVDGVAHSVDGSVTITSELARGPATEGNSDKKKVIGGAIAGAVIGQIMGRDTRSTVIGAAAGAAAGTAAAAATRKYHACLPAGSTARVTTTKPIIL